MVDWRGLWELQKKGLLVERVDGRFSYTRTGYRFDRYLIRGGLGLSLLVLLGGFVYGMFLGVGFHELYYSCPWNESLGCANPYYLRCTESFCQEFQFVEHFSPGQTLGVPPNERFLRVSNWASIIGVSVFVLSLLFNHFLYNRGKSIIKEDEE